MNIHLYKVGHVMIVPSTHVALPEHMSGAVLLGMATLPSAMLHAMLVAGALDEFKVGMM